MYGLGPTINYYNINIVIIPNRDKIDYNLNPNMSWINVPLRWGNLEADTPWDWVESLPFTPDLGNDAPGGPAWNSGWNGVGAVGQYSSY